jgi:hypothetical protein
MFCGNRVRSSAPTAVRSSPRHDTRVGDADRQRTAVLLGDSAAAGLLTLDELDDRMARTWSASTGAELAAVEADLPPALRVEREQRESALRARAAARASLGRHLTSYAVVMSLLVTIWLVVGMSAGAWYPWPVWPALGWGIGVVGHVRAASARLG